MQQVIDELTRGADTRYMSAYNVAKIYASLGDKTPTFAWLEKAYDEHNPDLIELKREPCFDGMRSDPRFAGLLRMNFPPYLGRSVFGAGAGAIEELRIARNPPRTTPILRSAHLRHAVECLRQPKQASTGTDTNSAEESRVITVFVTNVFAASMFREHARVAELADAQE
jgi:hypothetical protein